MEDYGKLPAMDMVRLSPSGERYAFVADDGTARRLYVATKEKKALQIVNVGSAKVRDIQWAGEDLVLVQTSSTVNLGLDFSVAKQELTAVIVLNLRTNKSIQVFSHLDNVAHVVDGYYGTAQINGRWYGFFGGYSLEVDYIGGFRQSNIQSDGDHNWIDPDLYRVDLETGAATQVAKGEGSYPNWLVGSGGDIVARSDFFAKAGDWKVMTGAFGGRELASGQDKLGGADLLGLSRTADAILIAHNGPNGQIVQELPLDGGPSKVVTAEGSLESPLEDPHSRLRIGTLTDGDEPSVTFFSPLFDARVRGARKAFPGRRVRLTSWSDDFNRMIVFTDGGDDPGTYWFVDIGKGSADPFGRVYPTVASKDVGSVQMIDYKAADGLALRGVLTLPPGRPAKALPLVVMPHGGPADRDYPKFDYWAQAFASRGYAVFQPNFRGSTGYGEAFYEAGYGQWGRKMQTDISDGVAELARQGVIDPKRACIVGWSYGGYAALAGVTVQHGLYRCAASMAGLSDLNAQFISLENGGGVNSPGVRSFALFLGVTGDLSALHDISPAMLAGRADAPILLIHGNDDTVVPIQQSDEMERALRAAGKPVERLTLKGADHWLLEQDTRVAMLKASVAFVEKYNPPDPAPQNPATPLGPGP